MAAQDRNRAPQNPATAPIKPRWSAIGSPEADDRREPASPDRHTKPTPPRARQTPASLPPGAIPPIKESRRCPKRYGFFNSLLVPCVTSEEKPQPVAGLLSARRSWPANIAHVLFWEGKAGSLY